MQHTANKRSDLEDILVRECLCGTSEEAAGILDAILENGDASAADAEELVDKIWLQGLQDFLGVSRDEAVRVLSKASGNEEENDSLDGHSGGDQETGKTTEEEEFDDGELIGEGECELCERFIKLTRHHLVPRSTWPRMESRLLQAADAASVGDTDRAVLIAGPGLEHLIPSQVELKQYSSGNAKRQWVRRVLQRTCQICAPCHGNIHRHHQNMELASEFNTVDRLLRDDKIRSFSKWASKQRTGKYAVR